MRKILVFASALFFAVSANAGTATFNFNTDPSTQLTITGNNPEPWKATGGNPGGYLSITDTVGSQNTTVVFPDIDAGKVVTSFKFVADVRIGNGAPRPADGFSISYARAGDPVIETGSGFAGGVPEGGTTTGIAISFDTWSGNTLPDGPDIEGIIIRVDNVTVLRKSLPTRHGACDDLTSLQTGLRDAVDPTSTTPLCWQKVEVELATDGKLTVKYKSATLLDKFQTSYFPSAGRLVMAGRTGGAWEHHHVDNITITTTSASDSQAPTLPGNLTATALNARNIKLSWTASTDDSGTVGYEIERNGTVLPVVRETTFNDRVAPNTTYTYKVRSVDPAQNKSAFTAAATAKTPVEVLTLSAGFLKADVYMNIGGVLLDDLRTDPRYPNVPDRTEYVTLFEYPAGTPTTPPAGDIFNNYGVSLSGFIVPKETATYIFYLAADDNAELYLSTNENPSNQALIASEPTWNPVRAFATADRRPGCPNACENVSAPIRLEAGKRYSVRAEMKEGGGGDNLAVTWIKQGEKPPADGAVPLLGGFLAAQVNADLAPVLSITEQPKSVSVAGGSKASFTVGAKSDPDGPIAYQWQRNGVDIPGGIGATYNTSFLTTADGGKIRAVVSVPGKSLTSDEVTLTVTADTEKPTIAKVNGTRDGKQVLVIFSEQVTSATAGNRANYAFSGGLTVSSVEVTGLDTVKLTTSQQTRGTKYTLTVNNVQDAATPPNVASNAQRDFIAWDIIPGIMTAEIWFGVTGGLDGLKSDPRYLANTPDRIETVKLYEYPAGTPTVPPPADVFSNYGWKVSGYFIPKETANYTFFLATDDPGELYLSTDDTPGKIQVIATEPTWNPVRAFRSPDRRPGCPDACENRSQPIRLEAGKRYFTEAIAVEGGGGDNLAVTVVKSSEVTASFPPNGYAPLNGDVIAGLGDPTPEIVVSTRTYSIGLNFGADEPNTAKRGTMAAAEVAGVPSVAQGNWNNLSLLGGTNSPVVADAKGTAEATTATVTFASNNTWSSSGRGEENNKFATNSPDFKLMLGYLDSGAATTTSVTVSSVPPQLTSVGYDVYVYAIGGVGGKGGGYRIVDSVTKKVLKDYVRFLAPTNTSTYVQVPHLGGVNPNGASRYGLGNYIVFSGLTSPNITIEATTAGGLGTGNGPRAPINAIQLVAPTPVTLFDVTQPGDTIVSSSTAAADSPAAEGVVNVIDNQASTKYLNFKELDTGFTVTPSAGSSIVSGIGLISANDSPDRDPASYKIEGSNDGSTYTLISQGTVAAFSGRFIRQELLFANTTAYTSYKVTFPTVANAASANSMQIADVELLGKVVGGPVAPKISIGKSGANLVITYSGTLQSADSVTGPFTAVAGAASPFTVAAPGSLKFYIAR